MVGHVAPEAQVGGPLAVVNEGDTISIDIDKYTIELEVPAEEIARRLKSWKAPEEHYKTVRVQEIRATGRVGIKRRGDLLIASAITTSSVRMLYAWRFRPIVEPRL